MVYAQIKNGIIVNTFKLDNVALLPNFSKGFDSVVQIDTLDPKPQIGYTYNGSVFTAPVKYLTPAQQLQASVDFGQKLINEFMLANASAGITSAQTQAVMNYLANLYNLLSVGALSACIDVLNAMVADTSAQKTALAPFVTNDILSSYITQIQSFLNPPSA